MTQFGRNDTLYQALEGLAVERFRAGDAGCPDGPAYIHGAIRQGAEVGLKI